MKSKKNQKIICHYLKFYKFEVKEEKKQKYQIEKNKEFVHLLGTKKTYISTKKLNHLLSIV